MAISCNPSRKGLITGIVICCYAFGAFCFNLLVTFLINPNNIKPDQEHKVNGKTQYLFGKSVSYNLPRMFLILGSIYTGIFIFSFFLIHFTIDKKQIDKKQIDKNLDKKESIDDCNSINIDCNKDSNQHLKVSDGPISSVESSEDNENSKIKDLKKDEDKEVKLKSVFASLQFYQIFFSTWFLTLSSYFIMANIKTLGLELGYNDNFLTIVGSVGSILNGILRPLWGMALDKTSYRVTVTALAILQLVICLTFPFVMEIKACFLIWYSILCSCIGGVNTQLVPISISIYGQKTGIKVFSFLMIAITFSNISLYLIQYFVLTNVKDPDIYFSLAGLCGAVAIYSQFFKQKSFE